MARSDDRPGLCWIDRGESAYQASVAEHTTTALTADEIHQIGLDTVAQLADEARALGKAAFGTDNLAELIARLRDDAALRFSSSGEIVAAATAAFERGQEALTRFVGTSPVARCEVRQMPALEASRMMQAYYRPGSHLTGAPGVFWINADIHRGPTRYELETLVAHESVPGHHVQWSMAREMPLPRYRSFIPTTAFIEGWALYCERNADELGLFTHPLSRLGMWSSQSWRASRLVVDTGLHAKGWSRSRAIDYLLANTATSRENAGGEVDRYIGNPGQALAYSMGLRQIQQVRTGAEAALGSAFDLREFHDRLLANGSPPLPLVKTAIGEWVDDCRSHRRQR